MTINVTDIAHVRFVAPDLDAVHEFYTDFGLTVAEQSDDRLVLAAGDGRVVHLTERGADACFVGLAFDVSSPADLDHLVDEYGFARPNQPDPLLGDVVAATDPNGFLVEAVVPPEPVAAGSTVHAERRLPVNDGWERPRRGAAVRLAAGPSHVERLGHAVVNVTDFRESEAWYKERFGLVTSDEIRLGDDETTAIGAFLRCDRGPVHVDHHTLFLVGSGTPSFNHAAFEVRDHDDLMLGYSHLVAAGRDHQWGVGRHILGSQVFDYWNDPNGFTVEHWTDGDLFDADHPAQVATLDELMGSQWGPTAGGPPA